MVIAAASSLSLGHSHCQLCHADGFSCSTSYRVTSTWIKSPIDSRKPSDCSSISCRYSSPYFGTQFHWSSAGRDHCLWKVSVAADYSDSVPDSSSYTNERSYHPLEDIKVNRRTRETQLTSAEMARTTVEANNSALLVFPGTIHSEPHEQISWADFQYVIDDYGDIFFQIFDVSSVDDIPFDDDYFEIVEPEMSDVPVDWGMPDTSSWIHPMYFAKCLTKAIDMEYDRKMDNPSNGVSIVGCLRPAFADEESYLRRLFHFEDNDEYYSNWKDAEILSFSPKTNGSRTSSTIYRLEIMRIELFSVYGIQSAIGLEDFQDAEPDILAHSTSAILEHFSEKGIRCNAALKALCKRKGLPAEGASLIGVDSLGIDVRIFCGVEVRTHRFPFKVRATCEAAAEKQIQQLLFPRSRRKKFRSHADGLRDS
ncbi:uncharacterized protein At3g49140 isoform X6 [Manihot esculenta]|uniref:uncharacterized protein At3g49140 isoform X6 n=1 Tax=Manihot esculenta TaxID=3983 RepID=UPI001CC7C846|nr:uncharacterized protein At3g49140 isoform X6 [Manihot esculenta]